VLVRSTQTPGSPGLVRPRRPLLGGPISGVELVLALLGRGIGSRTIRCDHDLVIVATRITEAYGPMAMVVKVGPFAA